MWGLCHQPDNEWTLRILETKQPKHSHSLTARHWDSTPWVQIFNQLCICSAVISFSLNCFQFGWGECHHVVLCWKPSDTTSINSLTFLSTFKAYHAQQDYIQFGSLHPPTVLQGYPKSSALLKPSHCPHTTLWEMQHVPSAPCCEHAILKGCNIALVWFQVFFDQNPVPCPTRTVVLY